MMKASLPLWATAGMHESGAAQEVLDLDGRPHAAAETRVRVQARQLYCFALAHRLGWQPQRSRRIVSALFDVVCNACRRPDGLYGRRIDRDRGALVDATPDLYDNAFVLLALATARSVLGGIRVDPLIADLLRALDEHMTDAGGGYAEFLPAPPYRLQNPHMHLFESLLAVYAATGDTGLRARIDALGEFVERAFWNEDEACVNEYGEPTEPSQSGWFEPGHSMEWVWLLGWRARLFGTAYPEFGHSLYARALDTLDERGRALMSVTFAGAPRDASRRLWSQTETLKAHLCMLEHGEGAPSTAAAERAAQTAQNILDEWLKPAVPGGWLDHFDADGKLLATTMPASSGYHLYCAIAELARLS